MKRLLRVLLAAWFATTGVALPRHALAATPERALCRVCHVREGTNEEEPVRAVRTHAGIEYGFCTEKCAEAFDADPEAYLPPVFPRPAPAFALEDLAGRPVSTDSLAGRVVLVDFWATWCVPCRKSMPELQGLHDRYGARGFTVLGISIDEYGPAKVRKFVKARSITYPIVIDSAEAPAWERYRVKTIPAAFLLDHRGRIVAQWTGAVPDTAEIARRLEGLLPAR